MKRLFIKSALAAAAAEGLAGTALAQDKVIKFANQNAVGHPIVQGMEKFKEVVEKNSGGKIKVNIFPSGQLGSDKANLSALQGRTLDMVHMNSATLVSVGNAAEGFGFPV